MAAILEKLDFSVTDILIFLVLVVIASYNSIKCKCLELAAQKVAEAEDMSNLTGEQKFALVVLWINESLPAIFRNVLVKSIITRVVQFIYVYFKKYARSYIIRKESTRQITSILDMPTEPSQDDTKSDSDTNVIF